VPESPFTIPDRADGDEFTIHIERSYSTEFEASLIAAAEAYRPSRDDIVTYVETRWPQRGVIIPEDEPPWGYGQFDGTVIPWAITSDALEYYTSVIEAYRAGENERLGYMEMLQASIYYRAEAQLCDSCNIGGRDFESVWVVHMTLYWSQYCGPECAMNLDKERFVVFDSDGAVLEVFGDGPTDVTVS